MKKYNLLGDIYFVYPPIFCFSDKVNSRDFIQVLSQYEPNKKPLCLYFHFPFCKTKCHYCYSFSLTGKDEKYVWEYIRYLKKNIDLAIENSNINKKKINAMHWGGGTPTYLTSMQLRDIYQYINNNFEFDSGAEITVEIDSRVTNEEKIETLISLGVNRLSFGIQDFNKKVLQSINRTQDIKDIQNQINLSRSLGIRKINVDLMFGLPNQSLISFNETLERIIELDPNQITLNNYINTPEIIPNQKAIKEEELPDEEVKLDMLNLTEEKLSQHGYKNYAYPYYAKSRDDLWQLYNKYKRSLNSDYIGFGTFGSSFIGNLRVSLWNDIKNFYNILDNKELPVNIGFKYNRDDLIRDYVINYMMGNQSISKKVIEDTYKIDFDDYFKKELNKLKEIEEDGLITIDGDKIKLTKKGRIYIMHLCMVFDRYPHWKEYFSVK